jgi:hypothetical protein
MRRVVSVCLSIALTLAGVGLAYAVWMTPEPPILLKGSGYYMIGIGLVWFYYSAIARA